MSSDARRATRRRLLAALAGVGTALMIACWTVSAAGVSGNSGPGSGLGTPGASPSPSPSPSNCSAPVPVDPSALPTAVPTSASTCSPSPSPSAGSGSKATPAPTGKTRPVAPGSVAGPAPPGAASPTPPPSVQQPEFLRLLGLLNTPANVGVENPTLMHFGRLLSADGPGGGMGGAAATPGPIHGAPARGSGGFPLALILVLFSIGGATTAGLIRFGRLAPMPRVRWAGLTGSPLAAAASVSLVVLALGGHGATAQQGVRAAATAAAGPAPTTAAVASTTAPLTPTSPLLNQLVSLEDRMSSDESKIRALSPVIDQASESSPTTPAGATASSANAAAATPAPPQAATAPAATAPAATPPATPAQLTLRGPFDSTTDPLGTAHQLALSVQAAQQAEYDFFLSVAKDPAQTAALMAAAASASSDVRSAVSYNMQAVQSQLAQEAAIAQAAQNDVNDSAAPTHLLAPLEGPISQPFGPSTLVVEPPVTFKGGSYPHFHTGIDIAGPLDAPIRAAADGVVALAGAETDGQGHLVGYGNYIVIAHAGKMITLYGHLSQLMVKAGQPVRAGDVIGLEGSTGNSTGPHLHFEVRVAGLLADPATYLGRQLTPA